MSAMKALTDAVIELAAEDLSARGVEVHPLTLIRTIKAWIETYEDVPPTPREKKFYEAHECALDKLYSKTEINLQTVS